MDTVSTTNLDKIKEAAVLFLNLPPQTNKQFPFIVSHPFSNTNVTYLKDENGNRLIDLTNEADFRAWTKVVEANIKKQKTAMGVWLYIQRNYKHAFLQVISEFLSDDDLRDILYDAWTDSEDPNQAKIISQREMIKLFKRADLNKLHDEVEAFTWESLPEEVEIYRGVTKKNQKVVKVFSWTLSPEKAEWFAKRFQSGDGFIYKAKIRKEDILAYMDGRGEQEIIVTPSKLTDIRMIKKVYSA